MSALSNIVVEEFCDLCDWAFQVWQNHRALFDDNPRAAELQSSSGARALKRLNTISHEYSLLQIAKLHDRAITHGKLTLGIDYIVTYGGWSEPILIKLTMLANKLNQFEKGLHEARNRALSHNDLAAILSGTVLGAFTKDEDIKYFETLQLFVNLVHDEVIGGPRPFTSSAKGDIVKLLTMVKPQL